MKILHILYSNKFSGAENVVAGIIKAFEGKIEMAYMSPDGPIRQSLKERKINYIALNDFSTSEIKKKIKKYKPDIIHAHDIKASIQAARTAGKIPIISHIHGNDTVMKKISLKSIAYLLYERKYKHIITVSKDIINDYIFSKIIKNKSTVLYNVINCEEVKEKSKSDNGIEEICDFVYLGRISEPKNPKRVARVASLVLKKVPFAKFGIIGDGDMKEDMQRIFKENQVIERVKFFGFQSNPLKILKNAKVMIMCSRYEGTPMSALEALALGVPIVSTPTDGMVELIKNGENGYISSKNSELIKHIKNIITDSVLHNNLSNTAIELSEKYNDVENYKKILINIYKKCLRQ